MKKYLLFLLIFLNGCAFTYSIKRHFRQGDQVYVQRRDACGRPDKFGEVVEQPNSRDSSGSIIYKVRLENNWIMPYSEKFLDSLNNWY